MIRLFLAAAVFVVCSLPGFAQGQIAVVNYSGFMGTFPVAPGSIASAFGNFPGLPTVVAQSVNPLPKALNNVRVRVGNTDAPLYFISPTQINFVVPRATTSGRQTIEVRAGDVLIASGTFNAYDFGPGLAGLIAGDPNRQGIIQNQNFAVNGQNARARRGEVIQIYATGCGATNPPLEDGVPPTQLSTVVAPVKVYISVDEAQVQFAGAHPQFPGICQVNAFVPNKPYITGQVPVVVEVAGLASNPVTVWVE
jgi:uncharacterized protein (TIGR03437 family)